MASDSSSAYTLLNHADHLIPSIYYQTNNENIIDLGLSLRVLQPPTYNNNASVNPHDEYRDMVEWNTMHPYESPNNHVVNERNLNVFHRIQQSHFVKVNMDGILIGRKICILNHSSYLTLATQLEDMFGKQSLCGLRLFESGTEFSLWYKDRYGQWRIVGDVPWKDFVDGVKRIRIMLN